MLSRLFHVDLLVIYAKSVRITFLSNQNNWALALLSHATVQYFLNLTFSTFCLVVERRLGGKHIRWFLS